MPAGAGGRGKAGLVGGVVGVVAAGAAVGLAVERYAFSRIRRRHAGVPEGEPATVARTRVDVDLGPVPADRQRTVLTSDGILLHVEEDGPADADLTVVFVHGYCLHLGSWRFQRIGLGGLPGWARLVFYDQRSHGRSARAPRESATVERLAEDLYELITQVAPDGPVALVGHSMGGMTILALAEAHPELFGHPPRPGRPSVCGAALVSTSGGGLATVTLGMPQVLARTRASMTPYLVRGMRRRADLVDRGRRIARGVAYGLTRRYSFGSPDVSPALVRFVNRMIGETPFEVIADFLPTITAYDKLAALDALAAVPTLVVVGERDLLTPAEHSRAIVRGVPGAELVVVDGAGHLALMESPDAVNRCLRDFLRGLPATGQDGAAPDGGEEEQR